MTLKLLQLLMPFSNITMNSVHPCCSWNKPADVHHTTTTCLFMVDWFGLQKYQSKSLRIYLPHFSSNDRTMESQAHCAYLSKRNCKNEPLQKAFSYTACDRGRVRYTPSLAPRPSLNPHESNTPWICMPPISLVHRGTTGHVLMQRAYGSWWWWNWCPPKALRYEPHHRTFNPKGVGTSISTTFSPPAMWMPKCTYFPWLP